MNEEQLKKQLSFLKKCANLNFDEEDPEILEEAMEELYLTLYSLRKKVNELISELPINLLASFASSLQILNDNQDFLTMDVQEELEMYFLFENIGDKVEELREITWDELINI